MVAFALQRRTQNVRVRVGLEHSFAMVAALGGLLSGVLGGVLGGVPGGVLGDGLLFLVLLRRTLHTGGPFSP